MAYTKTLGVALDCRNRLIVILACGRSLSHNDGGKSGALTASILRKCALKFRMENYAAFLRYLHDGTSSSCILYSSCIIVFRASDTSFSSICFLGIITARRSLNIIALYARVSSSSLRFYGFDKYCINIYFHHNHDVLVASLWACWELTCLAGEDSVPNFAYACVYVTCIFHLVCSCFGHLEGNAFRFGGPDIFS